MRATSRTLRTLPLLAVLALFVAGCHSIEPPTVEPQPSVHSDKGWELYALHCRCLGAWNFALLEGTNRVKHPEEVLGAAREPEAFLRRIEVLEQGESLHWTPFPEPGRTTSEPVPQALLARIFETAAARGLTIAGTPSLSAAR